MSRSAKKCNSRNVLHTTNSNNNGNTKNFSVCAEILTHKSEHQQYCWLLWLVYIRKIHSITAVAVNFFFIKVLLLFCRTSMSDLFSIPSQWSRFSISSALFTVWTCTSSHELSLYLLGIALIKRFLIIWIR